MRLRPTSARAWTLPAALLVGVTVVSLIANYLSGVAAAEVRLGLGITTTAALLLGARYHRCPRRAWMVLGAGIGVWVAGDFLWDMLDAGGADSDATGYLVANCAYSLAYPALFVAVLGLVGGNLRRNFENAADSATFALAAVVLIRMFAVAAAFTGNTLNDIFNATYAIGDSLLLGAVAWILFTIGVRNKPAWLLAAGMTAMLFTDIGWELDVRYGIPWIDWTSGLTYPLSYALIAAAALHPEVARLAPEHRARTGSIHRVRLGLLCASLGVVTLVALTGNRKDPLVDVCTVVLVVVIAIRFASLVGATERAYRTAARSERRFRALATAVPVGILEADPTMHIVFANEESERQLGMSTVGYQPQELEHIVSESASEEERRSMNQGIVDVIHGRRANAQLRIRGAEGEERWLAWYAMPAGDTPHSGAFLATVDITALKDAESMLSLQATHDALTGLPNRRLLFDRLSQSLAALERQPATVGVLFMDLDRFKPVNDDLGHDAGDRLLQVVAGRIQTVVRTTDTVARVGGDEFVVVLGQLSAEREVAHASAGRVAAMIVESVEQAVELDAGRASVAASIGIVLTTDAHEDPDALLRDADAAMYIAKRSGGSNYAFYDEAVGSHQAAQRLVARRHHRGVPHTSPN